MSSDVCVHFVGGGLAGITAASATYPLDLVRTRLAAQVKTVSLKGRVAFSFTSANHSHLIGFLSID